MQFQKDNLHQISFLTQDPTVDRQKLILIAEFASHQIIDRLHHQTEERLARYMWDYNLKKLWQLLSFHPPNSMRISVKFATNWDLNLTTCWNLSNIWDFSDDYGARFSQYLFKTT